MAKESPTEISQLDALELENLQLKVERAQVLFESAVGAFNQKMRACGERYKFDPSKDVVHFSTRKIERR